MSGSKPLVMGQPLADLMIVKGILDSLDNKNTNRKYLQAQAGYHLQQAAEKMIKIQIYDSGKPVKNDKIYKHSLPALIDYADELGIGLMVPDYIRNNVEVISSWEAEGRYDVHVVVRKDRLTRTYKEIEQWFYELRKAGH